MPLSPLTFAMVLEPLAQAIRLASAITGIKIGDVEHKLVLYADYVIITLTNPKSSILAVQNILEHFSSVSLYKINHSKSTILTTSAPED